MHRERLRVGYVVKRYPRFSETFIVNEILAHEAAGLELEIFALYPPNDTHFQDAIARVRAPVTYLTAEGVRTTDWWEAIQSAGREVPGLLDRMTLAAGCDARTVYQGARLATEARRRGLTHLHAHFATAAADVTRLAAAWAGIPWSVTAHAKDIFHESVSPAALRHVLSPARAVVTVSDFNLDFLTRDVGLDAERVHRIYNGLDLTRFTRAHASPGRPTVISVGRFVEKKGLDDLVEATALLRDRGVAFRLELVGSGPLEARLRSLVASRGLDGMVAFAGPRPQVEVIEMVRRAAVFAAPCVVAGDGDRDGLPTVLLEAMALGTAVVATDVVGIPEIVRDGETGRLVPQRDPAQLADALQDLLEHPARRTTLADGARALVEAAFDVAANAATLRGLFGTSRADARIARAS